MKPKEKKRMEQDIRIALHGYFGDSLREVDFCYWRDSRGVLVTYQDFKPESDIKEEVSALVGDGWRVVLKREYGELTIMLTLLKLYKENRVAIVDEINGELRPYQIRHYVYWLLNKE